MGGINLAQGVCDTPVPAVVQDAAIQAIHDGDNIYTRCDGIARLRQAIADKQLREYGLRYDPENEVMVASGATGGLHAAAMALLNPHDEVLLFEPFYGYHAVTLQSMRVKPVLVALAEPDWSLDTDALKAAVTPRTRAILLNSPANPSGKIFTRAELEAVAAVCIEHDLFLITDEIYEYFVYDGAEHISAATLPGMRERTIVLSGFSKTFSITGWRLGYAMRTRAGCRRWRTSMTSRMSALRRPSSMAQLPDLSSCRPVSTSNWPATTRTSVSACSARCVPRAWKPPLRREPITSWPTARVCPARTLLKRRVISSAQQA